MQYNDVELINQILNGDENAFVSLVEKYQKQVHALAWRKIGDFHIAEEITQDTFLKVYQKLSTLKDANQFSGWLYVIATNQCRAWLRKKRIKTEPLEETDVEKIEEAYSQYIAEEHAKATVETQREVVKKLLAKLKESERTVMTLHYFGEMTIEEISRFLGVSASAIKLRLHRARQRLKKEEPMIREALSNFKLSPNLTNNIMQKIEDIKPAAPSGSKPIIPWVIGTASIALIVLMLGLGSRNMAYFQQPYSLDSQSELAVELIDAPIVLNLEEKPDFRNQLGANADVQGNGDGDGQDSNQVGSNNVDYTQWSLPENVKARLGKGEITGNVAYSPDGTRLAIAGSIGIWIYDAHTGEEVDFYKSHGSVGGWRTDYEFRNIPRGHKGRIYSVCYSPDGKTLASGGDTIVLWDVTAGMQKAVLTSLLNGTSVRCLSFSPDNRFLASGHRDGMIVLWDVASGHHKSDFPKHSGAIYSINFSPDGKTFASGSGYELWLWDVTSGKQKPFFVEPVTSYINSDGNEVLGNPTVFDLSFSPDGKKLATGHRDNTVRLWDVKTRKIKNIYKGHTDFVRSVRFSPDGKTLISGSWDKTVRLWDIATGKQKAVFKGHLDEIMDVAYSVDGKTIVSRGGWDGVRLWDVNTEKQKLTLKGHTTRMNSVVYSPDHSIIASGHDDNTVRLWDAGTRMQKKTLIAHSDKVWCLDFTPDGKILASGGYDNVVRLWDVTSGKLEKTLIGHTKRKGYVNCIRSVAISSNGQILASASGHEVYLWNVSTGEHQSTINGHSGEVWSVRFSPDGKTIATGSSDKTVRLWDVATGEQKAVFDKHTDMIRSVSFCPDGRTIACVSGLYLSVWDVATGEQSSILKVHQSSIQSVSFSPDGRIIATGSSDKTVRLWDASTKQSIGTFIGHIDDVKSINFSPDGKTLASGSTDGTILLWDLPSSNMQ